MEHAIVKNTCDASLGLGTCTSPVPDDVSAERRSLILQTKTSSVTESQ